MHLREIYIRNFLLSFALYAVFWTILTVALFEQGELIREWYSILLQSFVLALTMSLMIDVSANYATYYINEDQRQQFEDELESMGFVPLKGGKNAQYYALKKNFFAFHLAKIEEKYGTVVARVPDLYKYKQRFRSFSNSPS